jgi:hypothetical protein
MPQQASVPQALPSPSQVNQQPQQIQASRRSDESRRLR